MPNPSTESVEKELLELAERLEAAEKGSRELDAEIMFDLFATPAGEHELGGPRFYLDPEDDPSWCFGLRFPGKSKDWIVGTRKKLRAETLVIERDGANVLMVSPRVPDLTTSLDAALALADRVLPAPVFWEMHTNKVAPHLYHANVGRSERTWLGSNRRPALAFCAALLKAKASEEPTP